MERERIPIDKIEYDIDNPRIAMFLKMFSSPTPEQIAIALGSDNDNVESGNESGNGLPTFGKLKRSIQTYGGIIHPIVVTRQPNGEYRAIDGNTRLAIYKQFHDQKIPGEWNTIPSEIVDNASDEEITAIRLQAHLIGPRPWNPYSKAKYLYELRTDKLMPFAFIVDLCGGNEKSIQASIDAYIDMEQYYRPIVKDEGFDPKKFSAFVELQKPGIKHSILNAGFGCHDFCEWVHTEKIYPLNTVRQLPKILGDEKIREIFLKEGAREALRHIDLPDNKQLLSQASILELANALRAAIDAMPFENFRRLKDNPEHDEVIAMNDLYSTLQNTLEMLQIE